MFTPASGNKQEQLKWLERIATLMDKAFRIPGTNIKIGLDPIIGLVPVIGDLIAFGISSILIFAAFSSGASGKVMIKMLINIAFDTLAGSVPGLGNVFDFFYRANSRNYTLLREHWLEGKHMGSGWGYVVLAVCILLAFFILMAVLFWKLAFMVAALF
jgi:hypothetical protein